MPRGQIVQSTSMTREDANSNQLELLRIVEDMGYIGTTGDQTKQTLSTEENPYPESAPTNPNHSSAQISRVHSKMTSPS